MTIRKFPEVKDGDDVRVVLEGPAKRGHDGFFVGKNRENFIFTGASNVVSIEVLPPKVGDKLTNKGQLDALPAGSVVKHALHPTGVHVKQPNGKWLNSITGGASFLDDILGRELVYLPES